MASRKERRRAKLQEATWKISKEQKRRSAPEAETASSVQGLREEVQEVRGLHVLREPRVRKRPALARLASRRKTRQRNKRRRVNKNVIKYLPKKAN